MNTESQGAEDSFRSG